MLRRQCTDCVHPRATGGDSRSQKSFCKDVQSLWANYKSGSLDHCGDYATNRRTQRMIRKNSVSSPMGSAVSPLHTGIAASAERRRSRTYV